MCHPFWVRRQLVMTIQFDLSLLPSYEGCYWCPVLHIHGLSGKRGTSVSKFCLSTAYYAPFYGCHTLYVTIAHSTLSFIWNDVLKSWNDMRHSSWIFLNYFDNYHPWSCWCVPWLHGQTWVLTWCWVVCNFRNIFYVRSGSHRSKFFCAFLCDISGVTTVICYCVGINVCFLVGHYYDIQGCTFCVVCYGIIIITVILNANFLKLNYTKFLKTFSALKREFDSFTFSRW